MFIVKYDSAGNVLCASSLSSGGLNNSVAADDLGNAYVGGGFKVNPFIVGGDTLILGGSVNNTEDIFISKFTCDGINNVRENSTNQQINIYPNPTSEILNINFLQTQRRNTEVVITNLLGEQVKEARNKSQEERVEMDVSNLPNGIYFVSVKTTEGIFTKKIIIQH
jgi:hypothetical protein